MRRRSLLKSDGKSKGYIILQPTAKTLTYNGTNQDLVNQGSATGVIMYSLDNINFSNTIPQGKNAANYTVYYYAAESANYTQSDTYTILCTIDKAAGYVSTAPTAKSLTYSGSAQALVNAGSGTGTMLYSLDNSSWNVSIPTGTNAGSYTVYYKVAANENYTESSTDSVGITISKAAGSVTTAPTNKGVTYSGSAQTLANAGSGTGTMYYRLGTSGDFSTTIPTQTNAGSWTLYYYAAESANYTQSSTGSITVTIAKANLSAPTASGATTTYNTTATATASGGGGQGSIEWSNGNTQTSVGSKSTLARWSGNANYNASAWSNSVTLTMNKAGGSVTTAPTNRGVTYNGSNQNLVNAGSGTGTMYYRLNSGSWTTSIPVASGAGSYTVYYYAAESTNYTQSSTGSLTATIGKANQSAPSASGSTVTYGSTAYASASGGGGQGSIEWSNGSSRSAVGSQNTQARWSGNANYNASGWSSAVTLTVNKAGGSVTTKPTAKSLTYSGSALALVNAGSGTGTMYYSLSSSSGFSTSIPTGTNAGTYTVYYYAAASTNYNLSSTGSVSVTIGKANSSISFKYSSYRYPFNGWYSMDHNPVSIAKGNGSISYSSSNTAIASIVTMGGVLGVQCHAMGSCTIYATISATTNYNSATVSFTQYVECTTESLGLPSGNLWATMNVGSSTVQGTGNYYMYGKGSRSYVKTDSAYTGTENPLSTSADTARQVWGGSWRTPTEADWQELYANTTQKWTSVGGVYGKKFTRPGSSNSIFIPAGGRYVSGSLGDYNKTGYYLTSTPDGSTKAHRATINASANATGGKSRTEGYLVRAVK